MQKLVFTNGGGQSIDLTSGNFGITNWEGLSGVGLNIQTQQVPFQDGGVFLDALMEQREISVTVAIQDNNDLSARYERKRQLISALNPKLGEGVLVYTNDYLARQIKAVPQLPIFENKNSNDAGTLKASVVFSCPSPYWEDVEDTVVRMQNHEIAEIENEGDIATQLLININTQNVTNPYIANLTTKKQIKLNFTSKTNIVINTRTGQKGVYTEADVFEFLNGFVPVDILEDGEKILMAGKGLVLVDMFGSISATIGNYKRVKKLSDGKYYAFGVGIGYVFSEDGIKWEGRNVPGAVGNNVEDLELLGNRYIATVEGERGSICSWNIDGSNPWNYGGIQGITSFGSIFIKGDTAYTGHGATTDGINYTEYTGTGSMPERYKYQNLGNGNYIGITGNLIVKSSNAKDWTTAYTSADGNFEFVAKQSGKYFALINISNATGKVLKSNTSSSWSSMGTLDFVPKSASLLNAKYTVYGEIYVAECYEGEGWNIADKQTTTFYGSIYKNEKYILVGYDSVLQKGVIKTTKDFNSFSLCFEADETINSIDFVNGLYVAGAENGKIFTSSDLITWNEIQTSASGNITQIIFNEIRNEYACVCESDILIGETLENLTLKTNVITSTSPTISYKDNLYYCFKLNASSELGLYTTEDFNNFNLVYASIANNKGLLGKYNDEIFFILSPIIFDIYDYSLLKFLKNGVPQSAGDSIIEIKAYCEKDNKLYLAGTNGYTVYENEAGFKDNRLSLNCYSIVKGKELYVTGENTLILKITQQITDENLINTLTTESDINLNLHTGTSRIEVGYESGNAEFVLSYRQKYIGV